MKAPTLHFLWTAVTHMLAVLLCLEEPLGGAWQYEPSVKNATWGLPTSTGPAPALTGGFGEATCNVCHHDFALNDAGGVLQLDALPQFFEAGRSYELIIRLEHAELKRAGFQLSARFADGTSAGSFQVTDTSLLRVQQARGVQYLSHNLAGTLVVTDHVARWRFRWVAPRSRQRVVFHVAANAANHDASEFGDRIYTASFYSEGSEPVKK